MLRPWWLVVAGSLLAAACATEPQPLDGVWQLAPPGNPPAPLEMTLTQHDGTVTGNGWARGIDDATHVDVSGTVNLPVVALTFTFDYTSAAIHYTAALQVDGRLVGQAVYDSSFGGWTDSLTYKKQ